MKAAPRPVGLPDAVATRRNLRAAIYRPTDVVAAYLNRLETQQGALNAAARILRQSALDATRRGLDGPLAGLPISVKETFGMAEQTLTAGSLRRPVSTPAKDAAVVGRLRAAGAVIHARSNVPELAMTGETTNLLFGRTNNALDHQRTAGGSSGGEGALVASGSSIAGVGSDILGSIRIPAAFNGIVGFKAAADAIDKTGTWPDLRGLYSDRLLALGTLTRSVRDAELLYNVIAKQPISQLASPAGLRLVIPAPFQMRCKSPTIQHALARARHHLRQELAEEVQPFTDVGKLFKHLLALVATELGPRLADELRTENGQRFSLSREAVMQMSGRPTIDRGLFQLLLTAKILRVSPRKLQKKLNAIDQARRHYQRLLGNDGILLLPTLGVVAPRHGAMNRFSLRPGVNGIFTPLTFCNLMDLAAVTLPAWSDPDPGSGLPPGITLACAPGSEGALLAAAKFVEPVLNPYLRDDRQTSEH